MNPFSGIETEQKQYKLYREHLHHVVRKLHSKVFLTICVKYYHQDKHVRQCNVLFHISAKEPRQKFLENIMSKSEEEQTKRSGKN